MLSGVTARGAPTTSPACRPYPATKSTGVIFHSGYTQSMISKPSEIDSTASSTAAASAPVGKRCPILKTISGSIFGANIFPIATVPSLVSTIRTVSSYMCAHTSVSSLRARHIALFANPTFRPTVR